ncbi:MAG TPA: hypothetical protein VG206_12670 [Terriglobia bacterium]|nr:hypothetical protein [Terriglobia bacterium]
MDFPLRLFTARPPEGSQIKVDIRMAMRLSLDDVRNRINELLEVNVKIEPSKFNNQLVAVFTKNTMAWRNLTTLFAGRDSYDTFELPPVLFETPREIQLEFMRGFADAAATPSRADYAQFGAGAPVLHRIVLQVQHNNWILPIQICRMLQVHLDVPVQHILWGHPNMRDPHNRGKQWAKEHRIRIYAENFMPVGFRFAFKQQILQEMASHNEGQGGSRRAACNPLAKHRVRPKTKHPEEKSKRLPEALRRKHFNAYFQICKALGCSQGTPSNQLVLIQEL